MLHIVVTIDSLVDVRRSAIVRCADFLFYIKLQFRRNSWVLYNDKMSHQIAVTFRYSSSGFNAKLKHLEAACTAVHHTSSSAMAERQCKA